MIGGWDGCARLMDCASTLEKGDEVTVGWEDPDGD